MEEENMAEPRERPRVAVARFFPRRIHVGDEIWTGKAAPLLSLDAKADHDDAHLRPAYVVTFFTLPWSVTM